MAPSRRSLQRTAAALGEFGRDGATVYELRLALDLGRGHRGPGPWLDALLREGRVTIIPGSIPRYRLRAATDREVAAALLKDAERAIARAGYLRGILAERHRRG